MDIANESTYLLMLDLEKLQNRARQINSEIRSLENSLEEIQSRRKEIQAVIARRFTAAGVLFVVDSSGRRILMNHSTGAVVEEVISPFELDSMLAELKEADRDEIRTIIYNDPANYCSPPILSIDEEVA